MAVAIIGVPIVLLVFVNAVFNNGPASDEEHAANAREAMSLVDFDVVCTNSSMSNAAPYRKPYKIVAFHQAESELGSDRWHEVQFLRRAGYHADDDAFLSVNVVACLRRKAGSEVKIGSCDHRGARNSTSTVDLYAVDYDMELREAKTGKKIKGLGTVRGSDTSCALAYGIGNPGNDYSRPDSAAVDAKLAEFVAG